MAKNLYETADDTLRGESIGQLSPEAQSLWDRYNQVYGAIENAPVRTLRLRSGATTQIPDPGVLMKQRVLQRVLGGMGNTGLGARVKAQPGALSQFAPFVTALGGDPKFQKWLSEYFRNGNSADPSGFQTGSSINDDWWNGSTDDSWIDSIPIDDTSYYDYIENFW